MELIRYTIDVITDNNSVTRGIIPIRPVYSSSGFIFGGFIFSGFIFSGFILVALVI